jgi:hypothetical protein
VPQAGSSLPANLDAVAKMKVEKLASLNLKALAGPKFSS